ncbi:MAG: GGDEF domain-containing protein [Lachnospiraceae bacterium]|nr:GGDEF domain-containing protein [Lachnospiraceae bacterium]
MCGSDTEIIIESRAEDDEALKRPTLFVCQERTISEYRLQGCQHLGRPAEGTLPDIPVYGKFVSRDHGVFDTQGEDVVYTALQTTNGIKYRGKLLEPWSRIHLKDGDELIIPSGNEEEDGQSAILVYATSPSRIRMWRDLEEASRDKLTGLCGREGFMIWWSQNYRKKDYEEAILFIMDVDDVKQINDKWGHNAGDSTLRLVSDQLTRMVRYENQVCRWGGDEFVGVIPGTPEKAEVRLRALSHRIKETSIKSGIPVTVSIGYVDKHALKSAKDMGAMLELADQALYKVKASGKGGIAAYAAE